MNLDHIATVDYADYTSEDPSRKEKFIKELGDSFVNMGFAIVQNHGVSEELKQSLYSSSKSFFSLPDSVKENYEFSELNGQRGYVGKNKESAKGRTQPDLKEFFHIGQINKSEEYPDNIWVKECPSLETVCTEVYQTFENTGKNLLKATALYLNLDEDYFDDKIKNGNSILRLLHYYPIKSLDLVKTGAVRAAAHGDINLITLLMGANAEGLQAQSLSGEWIDVNPKENEIVINIGDMLSRLTNGKLRSTIHRVINPSPEKMLTSRYSTPFFLHPRLDMDLSCLQSCIDENNKKQFEDITAGEFLHERLVELGLIKS